MDPKLRLATVVVGLGVLATAPRALHGEARPRYGGAAVGTLLGRPATLDPVHAHSHAEVSAVGLVFDALYRVDATGIVVPHLAAAVPAVSDDGKEARVTLIDGVSFHDGRPLRAADVVASLERARKTVGFLAPVTSVRADGAQVVLALARPLPELAALLAAPATSITPGGRAPVGRAIGTGPFAVVALDERKHELRLAANPGHFAGRPYLDQLTLRWFETADDEARGYESGTLDLSLRGAVAFAGHQPKRVTREVSSRPAVLVYVGFGAAHRALEDRSLRRAISLAIGREALRGPGDRVAPTTSPLPADLGGEAGAIAADLPQASVALAGAVAQTGALNRERFEVLVDRSRPDDRAAGEKVVAALYRLGLSATISELAPVELADRVARGSYDLRIDQLAIPTRDAGAVWAAAFAAGGDAWLARRLAAAPLDQVATRVAFGQHLPIAPLFHRAIRVHHRADLWRVGLDALGRVGFADVFYVLTAEAAR